jgi:sugar transferase EpsL
MFSNTAKRGLDVILSFMALVALAPVIAITALAVGFYLGSPIIFKQYRPGLNGRLFKLYKFRTMTSGRITGGDLAPDVDRLTPFGSFLRSWSLDELPQLWNVLIGDMSLVGPRPLLVEYLKRYSPFQARRHEVKPGLTGWAQINGRNTLRWEEKFALDVWYVDNRSLRLDLIILLRTVGQVIARRGITRRGHVTAPPFLGPD